VFVFDMRAALGTIHFAKEHDQIFAWRKADNLTAGHAAPHGFVPLQANVSCGKQPYKNIGDCTGCKQQKCRGNHKEKQNSQIGFFDRHSTVNSHKISRPAAYTYLHQMVEKCKIKSL